MFHHFNFQPYLIIPILQFVSFPMFDFPDNIGVLSIFSSSFMWNWFNAAKKNVCGISYTSRFGWPTTTRRRDRRPLTIRTWRKRSWLLFRFLSRHASWLSAVRGCVVSSSYRWAKQGVIERLCIRYKMILTICTFGSSLFALQLVKQFGIYSRRH